MVLKGDADHAQDLLDDIGVQTTDLEIDQATNDDPGHQREPEGGLEMLEGFLGLQEGDRLRKRKGNQKRRNQNQNMTRIH